MTFNTGNPIGSTDARDLSDNAENFDTALGTTAATWVDRFGVTRDSFEGRLAKGSFYRVGTFAAGYTLTNMRQTLEYSGHEYSWAGTFPKVVAAGATPATSGGIGAGAWVDRTDLTLRSELLSGPITLRNDSLSLKHYIHASDYGVVDDYYTITPTLLAQAIGQVTGYSYAIGINPTPTDNANAIQKAVNDLAPGGVLSFAGLRGVGISRTIIALTQMITIYSDNKDLSQILPVSGFSGTCLVQFGDGTQAYQKAEGIGFIAAVTAGNDVSGIEVNNLYNFEAKDIKAQSGNYISRECAGIDLIYGLHTKISDSNLHNSFCYGMIVRGHSNGLKIYDNAFDESDVAIISKGAINEIILRGNEFGSARPNPSYPAPVNSVCIDLRVGVHGSIDIDSSFSGGGGTKYHVMWDTASRVKVNGFFNNASRYAVVGNISAARLTDIKGTFANNGTDRTSTDPTAGTSDYATSPYCCDVFLGKAYLYPITLSIISDSSRPSAWVEGSSSALATSNVSIINSSNMGTNIAYTHSTLIPLKAYLQNGLLSYRTIGAVEATITARTITRGTPQYSNVSVPGAVIGDAVSINFKDTPASLNLALTGMVTGNNIVRWILVNTSDIAVTVADTIVVIALNKAK